MKRRQIIIIPVLLLLMSLTSCINDDESGSMQFSIGLRLVTKMGDPLPDSVVRTVRTFMFISGHYFQEVFPESNGRYYICFDNTKPMKLVAVGADVRDGVSLVIPSVGDGLEKIYASLNHPLNSCSSSSITETTPMRYLCYGNFEYTPGQAIKNSSTATLTMMNKNVRIHIVIRNLLSQMGTGNYTVKLEGFRSALAFNGSIIGDSVVYEPHGGFSSDGVFSTDIINALPTIDGERVTLTFYKDGNPIFRRDTDSSGAPITLSPEDDKAIVVDMGQMGASINIKIIPWSDVNNGTVFY